MTFTSAEARRQDNEAFSLSKDELIAYFVLGIIRDVLKRGENPQYILWDEQYDHPVFQKTTSRNKFKCIQRCIRFDDENKVFDEKLTNLLLLGIC